MRAYKTVAEVLLDNRMPAPLKIFGNLLVFGAVIGGTGGSLVASAHQTSNMFSTFHWPVIGIFAGEFIVWDTLSTVGQVIFCSLIVKFKLGSVFKFFANPIVLFWIDGHGLK